MTVRSSKMFENPQILTLVVYIYFNTVDFALYIRKCNDLLMYLLHDNKHLTVA